MVGVVLAVTPAAALVRLVLVGEAGDLRALGLARPPWRSPCAPPGRRRRRARSSPSTSRTGVKLTSSPSSAPRRSTSSCSPSLDPVLLAAGADDCVHASTSGAPSAASNGTDGLPRAAELATRNRMSVEERLVDDDAAALAVGAAARRTTRAGPRRCACGSSRRGPARRCRTPGCGSCPGRGRRGRPGSPRRGSSRISMSMKSMTMIPPMSRSRSWRAISTRPPRGCSGRPSPRGSTDPRSCRC